MEKALAGNLLLLAAAYSEFTGRKDSAVALDAAGDSRFFKRLREGKGFNVRTYDNVVEWFSARWPKEVDWPSEVERPLPAVAV